MTQLILPVDKIKQKLSKIPDDKLMEIDDFIDLLLIKSPKPDRNIVRLEGVWKGLGFEKIQNLETDIKNIRKKNFISNIEKDAMIEFLADTVAIIRHFAKAGRIGLKAKNIFKGADKGVNPKFS